MGFAIDVKRLPFDMSLDTYDSRYPLPQDKPVPSIPENMMVIERNNYTLAGLPSHSKTEISNFGADLDVWTIKNNTAYKVHYNTVNITSNTYKLNEVPT